MNKYLICIKFKLYELILEYVKKKKIQKPKDQDLSPRI